MANIFDYFFKRDNDETAKLNILIRFPSESEIQNASQNLQTIVKCDAPQWAKDQYISKTKVHLRDEPIIHHHFEYNFIKHKNQRDEFIKKYFSTADAIISCRNKIV